MAYVHKLDHFQEILPVLEIVLHHRPPLSAGRFGNLSITVSGKVNYPELAVNVVKIYGPCLSGLPETLARLFLPVRRFSSEDFPTLERPAKAISGMTGAGYWAGLTATASRFASLTIILHLFVFFQSIFESFFSFVQQDKG